MHLTDHWQYNTALIKQVYIYIIYIYIFFFAMVWLYAIYQLATGTRKFYVFLLVRPEKRYYMYCMGIIFLMVSDHGDFCFLKSQTRGWGRNSSFLAKVVKENTRPLKLTDI